MEAFGINGVILELVREYLQGRTQVVVVHGEKSHQASVISGMPQSTVLRPLLFVIYINDLLDNISLSGFLYADDTKIFRKIASKEDAMSTQDDIKKVEQISLEKIENTRNTQRYRINDIHR